MLCAQYWGKGELRAIERVEGIALRFSILISLLFAIPAVGVPPVSYTHLVENLQVEEAETPEAFYINAEVGSKAGGGETVYPVWIRCRRQTGEIEDFSCESVSYTHLKTH